MSFVNYTPRWTMADIFRRFRAPLLGAALLAACFSSSTAAAKGGDELRSVSDTLPHRQEAVAMTVDSAGSTIVTGYQNLKTDLDDSYWTVKFRSDGTVAWRTPLDFPGGTVKGSDQATAVAADADDNIIVTGFAWNGTNKDIITVKYDGATGTVIWQDTYNGAANGNDVGTAVVVDRINNVVYVGGYSQNLNGNDDFILIRYANPSSGPANPHLNPVTLHDGTAGGTDRIQAMATGPDGIAVIGQSWNGAVFDMLTIKYAFDGAKRWERRYSTSGAYGNIGKLVRQDASGNVIITGSSSNQLDYDIYTAKYSGGNGTILWSNRYNGAFDDEPSGLVVDSDGDIYLTGYTWTLAGNNDFYTARYRGTNGSLVWEQLFDSGKGNSDIATPTGIVADTAPDGSVYVTGYTETAGNFDFQTVKYKKQSGHQIWNRSFNGTADKNDRTVGIGLAPNGNVLVAGWSDGTSPLDGGPNPATGGSQNTIQVSGRNWTADQWKDYFVLITGGTNYGAVRQISGNTADTLTLSVDLGSPVTAGSSFYIYDRDNYNLHVITYDRGILDPPTGLTATTTTKAANGTYTVRLAWEDNSADEDGFIVERKFGETGSWGEIARVGADVTSYDDAGLLENNYYYYRVSAYKGSDTTYPGNEAHALTFLVSYIAPAWSYTYNSSHNLEDYATAIAVGSDDNPVVTGRSDSGLVGMFDYYTVKLNRADKSVIWADRYDSMQNEMDMAVSLAVDAGNNAVVSGFSSQFFAPVGMNINSLFTLKYPSAGPPILWENQYNGPGGIDDRAIAVASATDGSGVVVTGHGKNAAGNEDIYLVKYAGDGTQLWAADPFDGGRNDYPAAVAIAPSGDLVVAGYSQNNTGLPSDLTNYDFFVASYSGATGALIWSRRYNVTGTGNNKASAVAVDAAGDIYLTGFASNAAGNEDICTIKYSASGDRVWERIYDGPAHGDDRGVALRVDPISGNSPLDGNIVVAGTRLTETDDTDIQLLRYSQAGELRWERTLLRPHVYDTATAMEMDSAGYIYVAGDTGSDSDKDIISVVYDYEGTLLAGAVYNGGFGFDQAGAVTVNHQGEAFVAGYATNASGNADYLVYKQKNNYILAPTPFQALPQADYTKLRLTWRNNTVGTNLKIERTPGPVTLASIWNQVAVISPGSTSWTDTGLSAGTAYCYRIEAYSGTLPSRKIVSCATTTLQPPAQSAPSAVTASSATLTWGAVTGNTGYKIERQVSGGAWSLLATPAAGSAGYTDTGLSSGTGYGYRVYTNSPSGYSLVGNTQTTTTLLAAPTLNALQVVSSSAVTLTWTQSGGTAGFLRYRVERKNASNGWDAVGTTTALTYGDTALAANTSYTYRVIAVSGTGDSLPSAEQTAKTYFPSPVLTSAVPASTSAVTVTWTNVPGNTGYTVQHSSCTYSHNDYNYCSSNFTPEGWPWASWYNYATTAADVTSQTIQTPPLLSGIMYRFRVVANTAGNSSLPSNYKGAWTVMTPPPLTITPATETSLTLNWTAVNGYTHYQVERRLDSVPDWTTVTATPVAYSATLNYTDTGLLQQTRYCYRLKLIITETNPEITPPPAAYSNEACLTTPLPAPAMNAPTVPSTSQINLSWGAVAGSTGYEIQYAQSYYPNQPEYAGNASYYNAWATLGSTPAGTTTYAHTALPAGYSYHYRVRTTYDGGVSGWSTANTYATVLPAAPAMNAPSALSATSATITWVDVNGDIGYKLEWKEGSGGAWTVVTTAENITSYQMNGMNPASAYYFRVRAVGPAGESAVGNETVLLPAPTLNPLTAISTTAMTLSWTAVEGNNGYRVERKTGVNGSWSSYSVGINSITYTSTALTPGTLYYFRVYAVPVSGSGRYSNEQSAVSTPAQPVLTATVVSPAQNDLSWPLIYGATNYKIEKRLCNGGTFSQVANLAVAYAESYCGASTPRLGCAALTPNTVAWQDTGLSENTSYCYQVKAWNATGGDSAASVEARATTSALASPGLTATALNSLKIKIDWSYNPAVCSPVACDSPDGFVLEKKTWSGEWAPLKILPAGASTYTDSFGIEPIKTYQYRGKAYTGLVDIFDNGLSPATWGVRGATYNAAGAAVYSVSALPVNIIDPTTGNASITPANGAVVLATSSPGGGLAEKYNYTRIQLANPATVKDNFDVHVDFSLQTKPPTATYYHVPARLQVSFPNGAGANYVYVERSSGGYIAIITINGAQYSGSAATSDTQGKLRITRMGDLISTYYWGNGVWKLIKQVAGNSTAASTHVSVSQWVQRNETIGYKVTIDNFEATTNESLYGTASATTPAYQQADGNCP